MKVLTITLILLLFSDIEVSANNKRNNCNTITTIESFTPELIKTDVLTEVVIEAIGSVTVPSQYVSGSLIVNVSTEGLSSYWFADKSKESMLSIQELSVQPKDTCDWIKLLRVSSKVDIHGDRVWKKHYTEQEKSLFSFDQIAQRCSIHSIVKLDKNFAYIMQGFPCDKFTERYSFGGVASQHVAIPERDKIVNNTDVAVLSIAKTFRGKIEVIK